MNKALYYKLNTIFWFTMSVLPFLAILIYYLMNVLNFQQTGTTINFDDTFSLMVVNTRVLLTFGAFVPTFIIDPVQNLFINIFNISADIVGSISIIVSWFVFMHLIHLFVDILLFFVNMARSLLTKFSI